MDKFYNTSVVTADFWTSLLMQGNKSKFREYLIHHCKTVQWLSEVTITSPGMKGLLHEIQEDNIKQEVVYESSD